MEKMILICGAELKSRPIRRPRPNEVGSDVETYVMGVLRQARLEAVRPTSKGARLLALRLGARVGCRRRRTRVAYSLCLEAERFEHQIDLACPVHCPNSNLERYPRY